MSIRRTLVFAGSMLCLSLSAAAGAKTIHLTAHLQGSYEVPANMSHGHGHLDASYDTATHDLRWKIDYADLSGPATAAHFHGPAPVGKNAGVQVPISKHDLPSPIQGSATLTAKQGAQLLDGQWYFNVHTAQHPKGEIRGQIMVEGMRDRMQQMHDGMDHGHMQGMDPMHGMQQPMSGAGQH